jgi:Phage major capsid protein E
MHMNIFDDDAFSLQSMTAAVEKMPTVPTFLGSLGLFGPGEGVATDTVTVERKDHLLSIIPTTPRGTAPPMGTTEKAKLRSFVIPRVAKSDQVYAREIANVRAFGTESELQTAAQIIAQKQAKLLMEHEMTMERHRLGAIRGILLDADGSTLYNYFTEFGISQPSAIDFNLDAASPVAGVLRTLIANSVERPIRRALGSIGDSPAVRIIALCGDTFYDSFVNHNDVRRTYENWQAAEALRTSQAFATFTFAGVEWINYKGTDDNSTVAVGVNECQFIVTGVPGLYRRVNGPGETFDTVNTIGRPIYSGLVRDQQRNMWVQPEIYSYPLHMVTRPEVLLRAVTT